MFGPPDVFRKHIFHGVLIRCFFFCLSHRVQCSYYFPWILVLRLLHRVVLLECLWNSRWTTETYRLKSVLLYKGDFKSSSQYCPCYNSCKCLSWWPNPYGERKINCWFWFYFAAALFSFSLDTVRWWMMCNRSVTLCNKGANHLILKWCSTNA